MDCIDLVELVTECLEDSLERDRLLQVLDHLPYCKGCDDYFNQVLVTLKALSAAPQSSVPPELEATLVAIYQKWTESSVAA